MKSTYDRFVDFAMSRGAHASTPRGIALFQEYICAMLDKIAAGGTPSLPATGQRVFSGVLVSPTDSGEATWLLEHPDDVRVATRDEDWFGWAEGKNVEITVRRVEAAPAASRARAASRTSKPSTKSAPAANTASAKRRRKRGNGSG